MTKEFYLKEKKKVIESTKVRLKFLKYWYRVQKKMEKLSNKKEEFSMSFAHKPFDSDIVWDDEFKIRSIADFLGLTVYDEQLSAKDSTYFFRKKTNNQ